MAKYCKKGKTNLTTGHVNFAYFGRALEADKGPNSQAHVTPFTKVLNHSRLFVCYKVGE